jgi:hypothetical protein
MSELAFGEAKIIMTAKNITKIKHRFPLKQLRHLGKLFIRLWPVVALLFITGLLIFLNFEPNTYLTGWDNLHPEFDITENIRRGFFSVWQEYRGPGLLGGMAHAADLPRVLFIALLLVLKTPPNLIRYITTFLPLIIGPLGVYFLFYHHLFRNKLNAKTIQFASFLGSLYYLLNLNTLQTFFVPFETFTWFYGALPWLIFLLISYLQKPSPKNLSILFIFSFLSAPAFYVETIFLVFFVAILPFFVEFLYSQKKRLAHIKSATLSILSIVIPHLFWLLPVAFFVLTNGRIPEQAKNNLISSPETYARNLEFATLKDTALIKGYLFNYLDLGQDNQYTYLLSVWRNHLSISIINLLGFFTFILVLTGIYYSFKKKFAWTKSFVGVLALCLFFLLGGGLLINQKIPLVGELFRAPFTKFSIPLSLSYAFFFSIGTIFLLDLFSFLHTHLTYYLTLFTVTFSLIIFMSPAFSGHLISPSMRRAIPEEYFELFSYMRTQDSATRIASFPQFSFWGWVSYDWGYRGSGFLWHGLRQPLLDRAFDVWDKNSERYYEEMSTALYGDKQKDFEDVLDKYSVNWLLIDRHVALPNNATDSGLLTLENYVSNSSKFTLNKTFGDQISLYKVNLSQDTHNFISINNPNPNSFPFSSLSLRPNTDWVKKGEFLNINALVTASQGDTLTIPSLTLEETMIPVKIEYRKNAGDLDFKLTPVMPTIFADNSQLDLQTSSAYLSIPNTSGTGFIIELDQNYFELQLPAEIESFSDYYTLTTLYLPTKKPLSVSLYSSSETSMTDLTQTLSEATPEQCYLQKPNRKIEKISTQNGVSLIGTDVVGCLSAPLPQISRGTLLSLSFTYSSPTLTTGNINISGKNLEAINIPQPLEPKSKPTRARIFVPSTGAFQQVNLILEASESKSVREIDYQNIELGTLPQIFSTYIAIPYIPEKTITLKDSIYRIQVSLPHTETQYDIVETPYSNSLLPESQNCDQLNKGKTVKQVTSDGFLYQSQGAIECDVLNLRHLPHSLNYLISFDLRFQRGLAPTICLENHSSRRCDIQERLLKENDLQSIIQPVSNPKETPGYTLHLYNQSIGTRITSNLVKSISVRPIPLSFLNNIKLSNSNSSETPLESKIENSTHPYSFFYTLKLTTNQETSLDLYQTQSHAWKALKLAPNDLKLPSWLLAKIIFITSPFMPQLTHSNSLWHNSWNLPPGDTTVAIVYTPQYLQFVGFITLFLSPILFFLLHKLKNRHKKPR